MGLWDKIAGEFVDVIEWTDDSSNTMVYRFERAGNEIKYGAMLTVRESQTAVFVNEGQIADVFPPGLYRLETANLPILTTLQSWPHGFNSPFKAEIYFLNTRQFTDLKWGTKNPIMLRDPEFGPVRLRAYGTYSMRIGDPSKFLAEIVGTHGHFTTGDIMNQLRNIIVSRFSSVLGESGIPILDLAANYDDLSDYVTAQISPEFKEYGLGLSKFLVENISLPKAVEKAMDQRSSMGIVGNLQNYATFQAAEAMRTAAANPAGGGAAAGMGLGMGMAMAKSMGETFAGSQAPATAAPAASAAPPPLPREKKYFVADKGKPGGPYTMEQLDDLGTVSSWATFSTPATEICTHWCYSIPVTATKSRAWRRRAARSCKPASRWVARSPVNTASARRRVKPCG